MTEFNSLQIAGAASWPIIGTDSNGNLVKDPVLGAINGIIACNGSSTYAAATGAEVTALLGYQEGTVSSIAVTGGSGKTGTVSFSPSFGANPKLFMTLNIGAAPTSGYQYYCYTLQATALSTSGFTWFINAEILSNTQSLTTMSINWMAWP